MHKQQGELAVDIAIKHYTDEYRHGQGGHRTAEDVERHHLALPMFYSSLRLCAIFKQSYNKTLQVHFTVVFFLKN